MKRNIFQLTGLLLAAALCIFAYVWFTGRSDTPSSPTPPAQDRTLEEAVQANNAQNEPLVQENATNDYDTDFYLGNTLFIGDSRTNGFLGYGLLPPQQIFAVDGSTQKSIQGKPFIDLGDGSLLTVTEAAKIRRPDRILLGFGINALPQLTQEEFFEEYQKLTDSLALACPDSIIIIQSILPVASWKSQEIPSFDNQLIDQCNQLLYQFASQNGFFYMDPSPMMKDEHNSLRREFDAGDGLHFNASAYQALLEYYRTHMVLDESSVPTHPKP